MDIKINNLYGQYEEYLRANAQNLRSHPSAIFNYTWILYHNYEKSYRGIYWEVKSTKAWQVVVSSFCFIYILNRKHLFYFLGKKEYILNRQHVNYFYVKGIKK